MENPIIKNSNIGNFVFISSYLILIFIVPIFLTKNMEITIGLVFYLLFLFALQYLILVTILNFHNFYEDYIEIYCPMRIGESRRKKIYYSEIEQVKYYGNPYKGIPYICIYQKGKKRNHGCSFSSLSFKKSQKTLKFLQSKGISIEIESTNKKKQRILD